MSIDKIRVMISSRCKDYMSAGGAFALAQLRLRLREELSDTKVFGEAIFQPYINEKEPAKPASKNLWDECLNEVKRSHIVIALYNGDAGWSDEDGVVGICHAELGTALHSGRDRTYVVQLPLTKEPSTPRDQRFRKLVREEQEFTGNPVMTVDSAIAIVRQTLAEAVARQMRGGASLLRKDSYALGEALEWSRLSFGERKSRIEAACLAAFAAREGASSAAENPCRVTLRIDRNDVLFCVHAIPAAMSTASAREMVGRPFLADHRHLDASIKAHGPIHVIACHRSATEKQATDLLGFPDATVVTTTFGIYVVDPVQRVQLVMLADCRDQTSTQFAVQRLFDWLARSGQRDELVVHAQARARIVRAIQKEVKIARGEA